MSQHEHDWQPAEAPDYRCAGCGRIGRRILPRYPGDKGTMARPVGQIVAAPWVAGEDARNRSYAKAVVADEQPEYTPKTTARLDELIAGSRRRG